MNFIGRSLRFAAAAERFSDRILAKAWVSFALICVLQLKVIWKIWQYRDLTTGDTSSYFRGAARWADQFAVNIVWSPLYTAFYGTVLRSTEDVYSATTLHRGIIVVAATMGVLALMRRLLPPALALLIAAWWAILPINFETLYEVHLFALLPIMAAWLVAGSGDTPVRRGIALAILFATFVLVRNEILIATGIFALTCLVRERREQRQLGVPGKTFWRGRLAAYGIPATVALCACSVFYGLSYVKYPEIIKALDHKHGLNMCQVYAFGYGQRHPEWTASPWVECQPLMQATFGQPWPSLGQMIVNNPAALFEHVLWNVSLTFNGLQVGLFNAMSGAINPDYAPVLHSRRALVLSLIVIAVVLGGAFKAALHWHEWWPSWFRERRGLWLIMLSVACVAVPIIITQRPRPSYLFPVTIVLMAITGTGAYVLMAPRWLVLPKVLAVIGVPLLAILIPSYYPEHRSERPLYLNYERLRPFAPLLAKSSNRIIFGDYNGELRGYLRTDAATFDYGLLQSWKAPQSLDRFLDEQRVNVLFIQPRIMPELQARPEARQLLEQPSSLGWRKLAPTGEFEPRWLLLYRESRAAAQQ